MKRRISSEDSRSPSPDPRAVVEQLNNDHHSAENDRAEDDRPSQPRMQGRESPQPVHIYQQYVDLVFRLTTWNGYAAPILMNTQSSWVYRETDCCYKQMRRL